MRNLMALPGTKTEIDRRQTINRWQSIVASAAGLQKEAVTGRKNPHPLPGDSTADSQGPADAEKQSGEQQMRNKVEQKHQTIGAQKEEHGRRKPFDPTGAIIHSIIRRINP